jgi:hypothetical protein
MPGRVCARPCGRAGRSSGRRRETPRKGNIVRKQAVIVIVNACIWGAVMIGCSWKLRGTEGYAEIQNILIGGTLMSLFVVSTGFLPNKKKT